MHKYGDLLRTLLEKKGITDEAQADIFLNPNYERDLHDPFLMKDMERSCVRLYEAIENKEKIVIYADYDCDGIPGAVILQDLFKKIHYTNYEIYIPQRNSEGYGLNLEAIKQFKDGGAKLLITVDLGITAVSEVAQAQKDGIDVIITDHHLPRLVQAGHSSLDLPQAYAILNPKIDDYPDKNLCGAGVVFKLVYGFVKKYGQENNKFKIKDGQEKWMLDMAGLATLSDMVPLSGENRAISYFGMKVLRKSPRPGLQKLLSKVNIKQRYLSEDDLGFMVTPRLNAASRMDDPIRAFELLSTSDEKEAGLLVNHLTKINDERKKIVASIMREVNKKFKTRQPKDVIVIGNPNWKIGVLGLVAGKISDEHQKPVFVWGKDENNCIKGSCRNSGLVSVVELMDKTKEFFLDFGGHKLAGGFTIHNDKVHFLEDALLSTFNKLKKLVHIGEKEEGVRFDIQTDLSTVNMKNWQEIEKLAPFGVDNMKPVFLFKDVNIANIKKFGKNGSGEHLEIIFSDKSKNRVVAISFFSDVNSFQTLLEKDKKISLFATFDLSRFRGREELRLRIVDIV